MVLILDGARGYNWRGNVAAPREFRRSGSRNCRDLSLSEYRYLVIYGSLLTFHCRVLSISYSRFHHLSSEWPGRVPPAIPAYRAGCRLGSHKLAYNRVVACGSRHECSNGNAREME